MKTQELPTGLITLERNAGLSGRFRVSVVGKDGNVKERLPWKENLIMDGGLDGLATRSIADSFYYCAVGTGTTAVKEDSGAITMSRSGTTVTASAAIFSAGDVGSVIKADSGEEMTIDSFTSTTVVETVESGTITSTEFTIYDVDQDSLDTEVVRNNAFLTGAGNCGTSIASDTLTHKRTYDFPAEVGTVNYEEAGVSWAASAGANLFSRFLFGTTVSVDSGESIRVEYELTVTLGLASSAAAAPTITGWPISPATGTDGDEQFQAVGMSSVTTLGASSSFESNSKHCNEPYAKSSTVGAVDNLTMWVSSSAAALAAFNGTPADRTTGLTVGTLASASYVAGTFYRDHHCDLARSEGNGSIRCYGWGHAETLTSEAADAGTGYVFLFDEDQTKLSTHTLRLTIRKTWGRTLTN